MVWDRMQKLRVNDFLFAAGKGVVSQRYVHSIEKRNVDEIEVDAPRAHVRNLCTTIVIVAAA